MLCAGSLSRAVLHSDAVARRHEGRVVGRARIGALPQHHPRFGPRVAVALRDDARAHAAIGRKRLGDKVELVGCAPDVAAASLHTPGAAAHRLAPRQAWAADITATPARRTTGEWHGVLTLTVSKLTLLRLPLLCEVTASPARTDPLIEIVTLEPATNVQVTPSVEV